MRKLFLTVALLCFLFIGVSGQTTGQTDSANYIRGNFQKNISSKPDFTGRDRQSFSRTDSSGRTRVLVTPGNEFKLIIHYSDSGRRNGPPMRPPRDHRHDPEFSSKIMSQAVVQEGLYRLSEAFYNGAIDSSAYRKLYSETLQYPIDLTTEEIDLQDAKTEQLKAELELAKVELERVKLELEKLQIEKGIYRREQKPETGAGNTKPEDK